MITTQPTILVVDDEEAIRDSCRQILERSHYVVLDAANGLDALRLLRQKGCDLLLLDLKMPGFDGMEILEHVREERPDLDVIVITGYSSVGSAVECMRLGAYDYLPKPFEAEALRLVVGRAIEKRRLAAENRSLRARLQDDVFDPLEGASAEIRAVNEMVRRVAPTDSTVLILGESGTGKERVARAIHGASGRRGNPFLTVDCGILVETLCESELFGHVRGAFTGAVSSRPGRFELAQGGTLFLDEIGNIEPQIQAKLLRVVQEREVTRIGCSESRPIDVRILAATNQDLRSAIAAGRFREDLFFRLSVVTIEIPPLRARREDIPILAERLITQLAERRGLPRRGIAPEAQRAMHRYDWPGNVRELENLLERAMILAEGPEIGPDDLRFVGNGHDAGEGPPPNLAHDPVDTLLSSVEARHIRQVLETTGWHLSRAATLLGIDRKTLWRKIKNYRLR